MILLTTGLQAAYNALNILEATSSIEMWLGIVVQLVSIMMNVAFGLAYADTLFRMLDCNNLLNRKKLYHEIFDVQKELIKICKFCKLMV